MHVRCETEHVLPTPKQWESPAKLVDDLRHYDWRGWFHAGRRSNADKDLRAIIKVAVERNTFRAFHKLPNRPSETFRNWAFQAFNQPSLAGLLTVNSQSQYDEWLSSLVADFQRDWKEHMGSEIPFGPSFKLPNLLVKRLFVYREMPTDVFERIVWFLHVPLDSYTIRAVANCVESFPEPISIRKVPSTASMGFVKNEEMYSAFQSGMRKLASKAGVPPISLDCLAWDEGH